MNFTCSIAFFKYKPEIQQFEFREKKDKPMQWVYHQTLQPCCRVQLTAFTQGQLKGTAAV